jgi:hypothetical protein
MGVELALNNTGGIFYACSTGNSSMGNRGEEFTFNYPTFLGFRQNNTLFKTNNDKLQLLCHTKKATLDDINCYAYISLKTVGEYMMKDGYFTDFSDDGTGIWSFGVIKPSVSITSPKNGDSFNVGDILTVKAAIDNATYANLIIDEYNEFKGNLENQNTIIFSNYMLTNEDVGDLTLKVEVGNAIGSDKATSNIQIRIEGSGDEILFEEAIKKIAALIYDFEGSSYSKLTGDFDGQGISFGLLQWNFGQGSLQPLLISMNSTYQQVMEKVFVDKYEELTYILTQDRDSQLAWAKGINNSNDQVFPEWSEKFIALGNTVEFQTIQLNAQEEYITQARKIFKDFELSTERSLALAFDIAVQNWSVKAGAEIVNSSMTEIEKLTIIANSVANQSLSQWQEDVRSRKMTIVNGTGTVHGKSYNLLSDYDIHDRIIK